MKFLAYILLALATTPALAGPNDPRWCGPPARDAQNRIVRDAGLVREFARVWPKPQDGRRWYVDHVIPLACGGCDSMSNLQWLPEVQWREKSRWERRIYGGHGVSRGCL